MTLAIAAPPAPPAPTRRPTRTRKTAVVALLLVAVATGCMSAEARTFLDRTNSLRATVHVAPLEENDVLTAKAQDWAEHMASTGVLAHSNLTDGLDELQWTSLGENVGMSTPTSNTLLAIHNEFVASPPHRANLVKPQFTHMGVGVAVDAAGRVWVSEVFAAL